MKIIIETGSGAHTTSSASVQAKFSGGPFHGQYLYQQKQFQVRANRQSGPITASIASTRQPRSKSARSRWGYVAAP